MVAKSSHLLFRHGVTHLHEVSTYRLLDERTDMVPSRQDVTDLQGCCAVPHRLRCCVFAHAVIIGMPTDRPDALRRDGPGAPLSIDIAHDKTWWRLLS